jgi:osmotically-inducible protein OsmY
LNFSSPSQFSIIVFDMHSSTASYFEGNKVTNKSDSQLQEEVLSEFRWDTRVNEAKVDLKVVAGLVTLTGTVDSLAKKIAAQEAAHRVHGVLDVANDIQVKSPNAYGLTDTEIAQAVRTAINWDVWITEDIRCTVTDGWVTLDGTVNSLRERDYAWVAIRNMRGVRGMSNNLIIQAREPETAGQIKILIEKALERRTEKEIDGIKVEVHDGSVVLAGRVNSWSEKQAVLATVNCAPGVKVVKDNMCIVANK